MLQLSRTWPKMPLMLPLLSGKVTHDLPYDPDLIEYVCPLIPGHRYNSCKVVYALLSEAKSGIPLLISPITGVEEMVSLLCR